MRSATHLASTSTSKPENLHHHHLIRRFTSITVPQLPSPPSELNNIVKDLVSKGLYHKALHLYKEQLHPSPLSLTASILPSIIKATAYAQNKHVGLQLHCVVLKSGADAEPVLSNSFISMYAKFPDVECTRKLFDEMPVRDEINWSSMVNGFIRNGYFVESLEMFKEMYARDFVAKPELITSVVSACVKTGDFGLGREIHGLVVVN